ncbi:MAG: hypothetical protein ACRDPG_11870, partial [Nocardioidaceae bacterium]
PATQPGYTYTWNGQDAYGRTVQGEQPITVQIGYTYPGTYLTPSRAASIAALTPFFGHFSYDGARATADSTRMTVTLWKSWEGMVGKWTPPVQELGGWSLDVHHAYDPAEHILYLGNGGETNASTLAPNINTTGGNGQSTSCNPNPSPCGDGGPATSAPIHPISVAVGPDGSEYLSDNYNAAVRKIDPNGIITTVAGNGTGCLGEPCGDGGPATRASLIGTVGIALGPDGSLYLADGDTVRKVDPRGIITTIAGTAGVACSAFPCGDGGPATQATFGTSNGFGAVLSGLMVGPDGSIYLTDPGWNVVRKIDPNGIITTVVGNGTACGGGTYSCGDGGPAARATLNAPAGLAIGPRGDLFIADEGDVRVRQVGLDGTITTVVGSGDGCNAPASPCGDGGPATQASFIDPVGVAVAPDGSIYVLDLFMQRVRKVDPSGTITTVAGTGVRCSGPSSPPPACGDGGPAGQAQLAFTAATGTPLLAVAPDGSLIVPDDDDGRIRRVAPALPGIGASSYDIPSEDSTEIYVFDGSGRHLQTLNALTGSVTYSFGYDSAGRLISVTDASGNQTTIQRDGSGNPTAIVAPFGQTTTLTRDGNGYLATIVDPAGETTSITSTSGGLITRIADPNGDATSYGYDANGRLTSVEDPLSNTTTLSRQDSGTNFTVSLKTQMGRASAFQVQNLGTGGVVETNTTPANATSTITLGTNGASQLTDADGTTSTVTQGADPRFGNLVTLPASATVTTPGGLATTLSSSRSVTLSDPTNLLSLTNQTDTWTINGGRTGSIAYNNNGTTRTLTVNSPGGRQNVYTLDANGRITGFQPDPAVTPVSYSYDTRGRTAQISQGSQLWTDAYDASGRLLTQTDPLGDVLTLGYDLADRVTSMILPNGAAEKLQFGYDRAGNLTSVTMPNNALVHTIAYNQNDQPTGYTPPGGSLYQMTYNNDRQLASMTLPGRPAINYSYDPTGRFTGATDAEATVTIGYANGDGTERPASVSWAGSGTTNASAFTYDGELVKSVAASANATPTAQYSYTYDNNEFVTGMNLTSGSSTVNLGLTRDNDGLLTGITNGGETITLD